MQFSIHTAKTQLSKLIEAALRGEEVVIAKGSQPVVRLVPLPQDRKLFGALEGKVTAPDGLFAPLDEDDLAPWEGE
ncbi:MAG: type II toxin-antitoxin system prevent-host-death family antitoxin [Pseudomonadota bacterium]